MMAEYEFYYWPLPFRGQFIRAILAFSGKSWSEQGSEAITDLIGRDPTDQPVAFMGPPVLIERATGFALSQMPAIAVYLGDTLGLIDDRAASRALTAKVANDANDVIDELTLYGGREMWTDEKWRKFEPRLCKWMHIFESLGSNHALKADAGYLLGTNSPGAADILTATLWSTMGQRFPLIQTILEKTAPRIAGLVTRMQLVPSLAALEKNSFAKYGMDYCGGDIEKSLRAVLERH